MPPLTFGSGSVSVSLDNGLEGLVRRAIEQTMPGVLAKVEDATDRVFKQAQYRWPVRTGTSKAALGSEVRIATDYSSIRGRVFNNAPYARFIKSSQIRTGTGSAFVELLRKPMQVQGERLVEELRDVLKRTLEG